MNSVGPSCSLSRQIGQESLIYNLQSRKTNRQKQIRCYSYFLNKVVKQKMSNKTKKNTKLQRQLSNFRKNPAIRLPIHVAVQYFAIFITWQYPLIFINTYHFSFLAKTFRHSWKIWITMPTKIANGIFFSIIQFLRIKYCQVGGCLLAHVMIVNTVVSVGTFSDLPLET